MSSKKKHIILSNLLFEQRYLNNKFLNETDEPGVPKPTPKEPQTSIDILSKEDLKNKGINTTDVQTHTAILQQLTPYGDKVNLNSLQPYVGKEDFFTELNKVVSLKPETSKIDKKTITGEEIKFELPGGIKLKGTFNLGTGGKVSGLGDVGIHKKVGPVDLGVKYKNPMSSDFNIGNVQVGAKVNIPNTNKNKSHGYML